MLLGPVFHAELMTTSRRRRYYAARSAYGLALLAFIGWLYDEAKREAAIFPGPAHAFMATVAMAIVGAFLAIQVAAVLVLTPAMVAGAIAGERQRRTLDDLLASRLTSFEIVAGKLAARMLHVVVLVLSGLPILSILGLFGGLDPRLVVAAFAGTLTTAFALASLAILASALTRRARDAIVLTYVLELLWLVGPKVAATLAGLRWAVPFFPGPNAPGAWLDPFLLVSLVRPTPGLLGTIARMMAWQVGAGLVFVALAVWRLRPAANAGRGRRSGSGARPPGRLARLFGRPPVGDDPMAWKERHVARLGTVLRSLAALAATFSAVFLGNMLLELGGPAFAELGKYGYGDAAAGVVHRARNELNDAVALAGALAGMAWVVGLALTAAAGIPAEREEETWTGLLASPLSGAEILRGKAVGALHRWRFAGIAAVGLWTFGLVAGATHPLGYALTLALFAAYSAFALALGSFVGLLARRTTRALVVTVAILFLLNGGFLMCLFPVAGRLDDLWIDATVMPFILNLSCTRYAPVQVLFGHYPVDNINLPYHRTVIRLLSCLVSLVGYGLAAVGLGAATIEAFDRVADRPHRPAAPGADPSS